MLYLNGAISLLALVLWIAAVVDVVTTDAARCRNLAKGWWLVIVVVLGVVGAIVWVVGGRPRGPARDVPYRGSTSGGFPEHERPGRFVGQSTESDEEFLRRCRERAEEQRRRHRVQQRREEQRRGETDGPEPAA